jgi:hypothetical protein
MKRLAQIVFPLLLVSTLAGCSQIDALAPVGGDKITSVRNAANNVLVQQQVEILVAPTCSTVETGFSCMGSTVDNEPIVVEASGTAPFPLVITVDGITIFEGSAQDVLDQAVLEAS